MKIGILTFYNADNYGAVLQCYALQEVLTRQFPNDDISVIDYRNGRIEKSYKIIQLRKKILSNVSQFIYILPLLKKRNLFRNFRRRFFYLDHVSFSEYDVIFYGSDQIWNFEITDSDLLYLGKDFNGIKIAYAASDGGQISVNRTEIKDLLLKFDKIACREESLANKILALTDCDNIRVVCDPVFLLSKSDWLKIAVAPEEKNYILAYKVSENADFDREVEKISQYLGKKVIQIVHKKSINKFFYKKQNIVNGVSVERFLGYFANADFVITTSFHGTAFSLIFEKPFYILKIKKRYERIIDLLSTVGCLDRYVENIPRNIKKMNSVQLLLQEYISSSKIVLDEYVKFIMEEY